MPNNRDINLDESRQETPMGFSKCAFMVLRGRDHGNTFWTTGGSYREDWYEMIFESDDEEAVKIHWRLAFYGNS